MKTANNMIICLFLILSIMFTSGCGLLSEENEKSLTYNKHLKDLSITVINALMEHDDDLIESLFCDKVSESHNLKTEIEKAYEFIDGNIESYEKVDPQPAIESVRDGETIKLNGNGFIIGVKTDKEKYYQILIFDVSVYLEDKSHEGIQEILILNVNYTDDNYLSNDIIDEFEIGGVLEGSWN